MVENVAKSKKKNKKNKKLAVKGNTFQWNSMRNILYATKLDTKSKITSKVTEVKNLPNEVLEMSFFCGNLWGQPNQQSLVLVSWY
jgi:hypothetical protein